MDIDLRIKGKPTRNDAVGLIFYTHSDVINLLKQKKKKDPTSWTKCSIYRGLVPRTLATTWRVTLGGLPKPIVSQVTRWFCRYIEREGREQIWKTRCQETVAWEKENGITEQQKKVKAPQGSGRRWQQIYGRTISEQECMCGYLLDDHFDGGCPGEQDDCWRADQQLLKSLLGQRHLGGMEKKGKIVIKSFEEEA